jgi:hypothetical protein
VNYPNRFAIHGSTKTAIRYTTIGTTAITTNTPRLADLGLLFSSIVDAQRCKPRAIRDALKTQVR